MRSAKLYAAPGADPGLVDLTNGQLDRGDHVEGGALGQRIVAATGQLHGPLGQLQAQRIDLGAVERFRHQDGGVDGDGWSPNGQGVGLAQQTAQLTRRRHVLDEAGCPGQHGGRQGQVVGRAGVVAAAEGHVGGFAVEP